MTTRFSDFELGPAVGQVMLPGDELMDVKYDGVDITEVEVGHGFGNGWTDAVLVTLTMAGNNMPLDLMLTPDEAVTIANEIIRMAEVIKQKEGAE